MPGLDHDPCHVFEPLLDVMRSGEQMRHAVQSLGREIPRGHVGLAVVSVVQEILVFDLFIDLFPRADVSDTIDSGHHGLFDGFSLDIP